MKSKDQDKAPLKVFLDDERIPSQIYGEGADDEWTLVTTIDEVKTLLTTEVVSHLSLDNDLGSEIEEGHLLLPWMMGSMKWPTEYFAVHSANSYWSKLMKEDINRYFYGCVKPQRERELREAEVAQTG